MTMIELASYMTIQMPKDFGAVLGVPYRIVPVLR
jgi:hypothetical protein